jgi:ABC-2 type transport system ATP-binding protein
LTLLLSARGVAKRYGPRVALEPTDLDLAGGEIVALVGPNGAGKSTLLAILARALEPTAGTVRTEPGVGVGWMPQRPAHYSRLSARQNLELFARLEGERDAAVRATELIERFDIPDDDRPSMHLSVGNRQRLNLALALLGSPRVLLVDEPTASLDADQRERFWETAEALRTRGGSVVLVTQNTEDVERLADRVLHLVEGRVVD